MKKDTLTYLCAISVLALSDFADARKDQEIHDTYVEYDSGWVSSTPEPSKSTYYDYSNDYDPAAEKKKKEAAEKKRIEEKRKREEEERKREEERLRQIELNR